jgi:5-formyltetrahydrofolate cyclo-ligase
VIDKSDVIKAKKKFRKMVNTLNKELKDKDFSFEDKIIIDRVVKTEVYKKSNIILIYYPMYNEVNTLPLISKAMDDDKRVGIPKIIEDRMHFVELNKNWEKELTINKYGIEEPNSNEFMNSFENTLMIVPNLALSRDKKRIGHGKGYYDIFLEDHKDIFKMGICREHVLFDTLPVDENDKDLDLVISSV